MTGVRKNVNIELALATTELLYYRDDDGTVPLVEWFDGLPVKAIQKCQAKLERLEELGH